MCGRIGITKQRTYLKYCNGAETFYSYYSTRRRLQNLVVNAKAGTIMNDTWVYGKKKNFMKGLLDGNFVTSSIRSYNTNMDIRKNKDGNYN